VNKKWCNVCPMSSPSLGCLLTPNTACVHADMPEEIYYKNLSYPASNKDTMEKTNE
jgi:hypothetical protein